MMRFLSSTVSAYLFIAGCAGEIVDIDRTEPNRISKAIFTGEWYMNATVVDAEFNQNFVFEGLMSGADRIRWDLQENVLIAYRSYQTLEGAEEGNTESLEFQGTVVAMFTVQSHFDVFRDYNPSTGEQSNVLVENTTDRPWWERDYVRVDWSRNLVADRFNLSGVVSAIAAAPYYVQEHEIDNPFRAEVGERHINVVGNYILEPQASVCSGSLQDSWCGASSAKLKLSFMRVPDSTYEPLQYPDRRVVLDGAGNVVTDCDGDNDGVLDGDCEAESVPVFERFGYFRTERRRYDNDALWTRDGRIFLAQRWNIWGRSTNVAGTPIPLENRETRTITYVTNVDFPDDPGLHAMNDALIDEWDAAFRQTVAEIRTLGGVPSAAADVPPILVWRRNRCNVENAQAFAAERNFGDALSQQGIAVISRDNLKRACATLEYVSGGEFTWEKAGDLRHSFLNWVPNPQQQAILGYGPSAADPLTGEIISAHANVYGGTINTYAAFAADIAELLNGSLDEGDLARGVATRVTPGASPTASLDAGKVADLRERFRGLRDELVPNNPIARERKVSPTDGVRKQLRPLLSNLGAPGDAGKLERVRGSQFEREVLTTDDISRAMEGANAESLSPLSWVERFREVEETRARALGAASIMTTEWADSGIVWLAEEFRGLGRDEIYQRAREQIYRAVQAHEMGHTLGLRHNFMGSFDALNFGDDFWRHYDPSTETVRRTELDGSPTDADRHMYSSIMEYMPRPFDDWSGIGRYDRAAIAFGYGQLVEVWDPGTSAFLFDDLKFFSDYAKLPRFLAGDMGCDPNAANSSNCHPDALTALFAPDNATYNAGVTSYLRSAGTYGRLPSNGAEAVQRINRRRFVRFDEVFDAYSRLYNGDSSGTIDVLFNLKEVDYRFCPDERVFASNQECQRWDRGANYREIISDSWERYNQYYWFNNFQRDRANFNNGPYINTYLNRVFTRHFGPMSTMYQNYLYGDLLSVGRTLDGELLTLNDFDVGRDWQGAALDGLNYLATVLHTPEPGAYCLDGASNTYRLLDSNTVCATASLDVPLGVGKALNTQWNNEYAYQATRIGAFWDKYAALFAITDNAGVFYRDLSDLLDSGSFSLSYWRGLPDEMLSLFNSAIRGETGEFGWRYDDSQSGNSRFVSMPVVDQYVQEVDSQLPRIDSATSWTLRYYALVLSMSRFNSILDYSQDFSAYARVCLESSRDCLTFNGTTETYVDPISRYRYIAPTEGAGDGHDIAAQLLREAQNYADTVYSPARVAVDDAQVEPFALSATEQELFDGGATLAEIRSAREAALQQARRGVNEYSGFLDIVRDVGYLTQFNQ